MEHYAGIDVSLELSSVCRCRCARQDREGSEGIERTEALVCFFRALGTAKRITSHCNEPYVPVTLHGPLRTQAGEYKVG